MTFVSNHDKNAWDGTEYEQFGECLEAAIVLSVIGEGMPLIYNGQEAGSDKRLAFFEKDPIEWAEHPMGEFYRILINLKKAYTCLHNAQWGARMRYIPNDKANEIFSFVRQDQRSRVFVVLNLSDVQQKVSFNGYLHHGEYVDVMTTNLSEFEDSTSCLLAPWGFKIFAAFT